MMALQLKIKDGFPLKPTGFWSTNPKFAALVRTGNYRCSGDHEHERVQSGNTAASAHYPPELA